MPKGHPSDRPLLGPHSLFWGLAMLAFALLAAWLLYSVFSEVRARTLEQWREQQNILITQISKGVGGLFTHYHDSLAYLAHNRHIVDLDAEGRVMMDRFYHFHRASIKAVSRVSREGRLVHTVPFDPDPIGADLSRQPHNARIMSLRRPVVSQVFQTVQGYLAVAYAEPIFKDGEYCGAISLLIPFSEIVGRFLKGMSPGGEGRAWVVGSSGQVLHRSAAAPTAREISSREGSDLARLSRAMLGGRPGRGSYRERGAESFMGLPQVVEVVYQPIPVGDTHWVVAIGAPAGQILSTMKGFIVRWLLIISVLMAFGTLVAWFLARAWLAVAETKKRLAVEEELSLSNQRLVTILDNLDADVYVVDLDNHEILFMNRRMKKTFGEGLEGSRCWREFRKGQEGPCPGCHGPGLLDREGRPAGTVVWESKSPLDGRWHRRHAQAIRWLDGRLVRLQVATDIHDLKEAEQARARLEVQLRHSQKMEAVGTLAGGVAHDFNNLLQIIGGHLQLLAREKGLSAKSRHYLEVMSGAGARAAELVRQLLTFSRHVEPVLRPLDLNELVRETASLLARTIPKMIKVTTELAEGLPPVAGDATQLEQVLLNLAANSRDAMPEGGRLLVRTRASAPGQGRPGEGRVCLEVTDTGPGIPDSILENIFEPFFTTKKVGQGTGLGLAMAYGIVAGHGGRIVAFHPEGGGAGFRISLPLAKEGNQAALDQEPPDQETVGAGRRILLVDDEAAIVEANRELLLLTGFEVLTAASGEEALDLFRRFEGQVDLVVLDLGMPGMGGGRCLECLRKLDPGVKVLVASGYLADKRADLALAAGAADFLAKPYGFPELLARIRTILGGEGPAGPRA